MNDQKIETIMEAVCEICHHPYVVMDQDELDVLCSRCPVERLLKEVKA